MKQNPSPLASRLLLGETASWEVNKNETENSSASAARPFIGRAFFLQHEQRGVASSSGSRSDH